MSESITSVLAPRLPLQEKTRRRLAVDDVSLGAAVLIGIWIFFVTARPARETNRLQSRSLTLRDLGGSPALDEWSFDSSKIDGAATEQADGWVLR